MLEGPEGVVPKGLADGAKCTGAKRGAQADLDSLIGEEALEKDEEIRHKKFDVHIQIDGSFIKSAKAAMSITCYL